MTLSEMQAITIRHWMTYHRKTVTAWPKCEIQKQSMAAAELTQMEMATLEDLGVQPAQAWSDCKTLFCLTAPPDLSGNRMPAARSAETTNARTA